MGTDIAVLQATVVVPPEPLSEGAARKLDKRIRLASIRVADESATLLDLLEEAERGQIHIALGKRSWIEYVKEAVNITPINAAERKAMVSLMAGKGLSTHLMAALLGVNQSTTRRDVLELKESGDANASTEILGPDGKTYKRERPPKQDVIDAEVVEDEPEPEERKASDVIDDFGENIDYLMPAVQAFTDILKDDAELFPKARKRIVQRYLNRLTAMIADLQLVVDELMES